MINGGRSCAVGGRAYKELAQLRQGPWGKRSGEQMRLGEDRILQVFEPAPENPRTIEHELLLEMILTQPQAGRPGDQVLPRLVVERSSSLPILQMGKLRTTESLRTHSED